MTPPSGPNAVQDAPNEPRLTFGASLDRVVVYLLAGLVGWLCINSLDNRDKLTALLEAKKADAEVRSQILHRLEALDAADRSFMADLGALKLEAARHNWEVRNRPKED